jgi:hypothetical protein
MTLDGSGSMELGYYDLLVYGGGGGTCNVTVSLYDGCPGEGGTVIPGTESTWTNVPDDGYTYLLWRDLSSSPVTIPNSVWMVAVFSTDYAGWVIAEEAEIGFTDNVFGVNVPPWGCNYWFGGTPYAGLWANLRCIQDFGLEEGGMPTASIARGVPADALLPVSHQSGVAPRQAATGGLLDSSGTVTLDLISPSAGATVDPGATVEWSLIATVSQGDNGGLAAIGVDLVQDAANPTPFDIPTATVVGTGMEGFDRPDGIANPGPGGSGYLGTPMGTPGAKDLHQIGGAQNTFGEPGDEIGTDYTVDPYVGQTGPQVIAEGSFMVPAATGAYVFRIENVLANVLNSLDPPPTPPAYWPVSDAAVAFGSSSFTIIVCHTPPQDTDGDGDVDLSDYGNFLDCYNGPNKPYGPGDGCECLDVEKDGDVDLADYGEFLDCYNGPNRPPACSPPPGPPGEGLGGMGEGLDEGGACDGSDVSFDLQSNQDGQTISAGTNVWWRVAACVSGSNQGLATYTGRVELRSGSATGPLVTSVTPNTALQKRVFDVGGNGAPDGAFASDLYPNGGPYMGMVVGGAAGEGFLEGFGAAYYPNWTYTSQSTRMSHGVGRDDRKSALLLDEEGDYVIQRGKIDTTGLDAGTYYVVFVPPAKVGVLRDDVDLEEDVSTNVVTLTGSIAAGDSISFTISSE